MRWPRNEATQVSKKSFMLSIFTLLLNIFTADCPSHFLEMKVVYEPARNTESYTFNT